MAAANRSSVSVGKIPLETSQMNKRVLSDQDLQLFDIVSSARSAGPEIIVLSSSDDQDAPKVEAFRRGLKFSQVPTDDEAYLPNPSRARAIDSPRGHRRRRRRKPRARSASVEALVLARAPPRRHIPPSLNARAFCEESLQQRRRTREVLMHRAQRVELVEATGKDFVEYAKRQWLGQPMLLDKRVQVPASLEEYIGLA